MTSTGVHRSLFHGWLLAHRGIIVKVARAFAPSPADAADLEQELLLQLWLSLPRFAGKSQPSTWIYRVCLNTALSWRRGAARRDRRIAPDTDVTLVATDATSPAERASERQLLAQLYAAIRAIPESERALVLLLLDGLAYREIAEITGLTENHVGVALTRARKRLAELMNMKGDAHEVE